MAVNKSAKSRQAIRRKEVLERHLSGETYREIADGLGCSLGVVAKDMAATLETYRAQTEQLVDQARRVELMRLDALLKSVWPSAIGGDDKAIGHVLKIGERRSKLLGLDAPTKIDLRDIDDETLCRLILESDTEEATPEEADH